MWIHLIFGQSRALLFQNLQGIVHRDVKPGNFLFSRKANKGYLIDFNLAMVSYSCLVILVFYSLFSLIFSIIFQWILICRSLWCFFNLFDRICIRSMETLVSFGSSLVCI